MKWNTFKELRTWTNKGSFYFCPLDISLNLYNGGLEGWCISIFSRLWNRVFKFEYARFRSRLDFKEVQ